MATATARKTISIHDYPEHLNPFREDDNHNKLKFWTIGRRLSRSNSINFGNIKDIKNSWAFRSFMKKDSKKKKGPPPQPESQPKVNEEKTTEVNGDSSPIVFRRALQYSHASRSTVGGAVGTTERYVYGGSVTPLPRSRFQERLGSSSQHEISTLSTPRLARSEVGGSRLSVESSNPFDEPPVPPVRASRRKKKKAPLPPTGTLDNSITSETAELQTSADSSVLQTKVANDKKPEELDIDDVNFNVELKIVEDEDVKTKGEKQRTTTDSNANEVMTEAVESTNTTTLTQDEKEVERTSPETQADVTMKSIESIEKILTSVEFPKVDIATYRRNSSVNEDDVRLRRGNLEDFHSLSIKRSKSLNNSLDNTYITYDINLNEKDPDRNGNEEPQKVVCKLYDDTLRKQSIDTISSTEKEFIEIDKVRREFETEINKLNAALEEDFSPGGQRLSVSEIKKKFDATARGDSTPNPIPKPRRSHYSDSGSPVNGDIKNVM